MVPPPSYELKIRQQPEEALSTMQGKEKARKPIDPPPILEIVSQVRPQYQYLQNPYLFVSVTLYKADKDELVEDGELTGSLVSSLHRLKDISNKDAGFFIFGDISTKSQGQFRLCFTLYEFQIDDGARRHTSVISTKFNVLSAKNFKGLSESTYLSRAFSDQGVRLRLRKEARGVIGSKRPYPLDSSPVLNTAIRPNTEQSPVKSEHQPTKPVFPLTKKARSDHSGVSNPYNLGAGLTMGGSQGTYSQASPQGTYTQASPQGTYTQASPQGTYTQASSQGTYTQASSQPQASPYSQVNAYHQSSSYPQTNTFPQASSHALSSSYDLSSQYAQTTPSYNQTALYPVPTQYPQLNSSYNNQMYMAHNQQSVAPGHESLWGQPPRFHDPQNME